MVETTEQTKRQSTVVAATIKVTVERDITVERTTTMTVTHRSHQAAEGVLNGVAGDINRGWLGGRSASDWNAVGKGNDRPGHVQVVLTTAIGDDTEKFEADADTTGSMTRAIIGCVDAVTDAAQEWASKLKRSAAGMPW